MKLKKFQKKIGKLNRYEDKEPKGLIAAMFCAEEGAEILKCYRPVLKDGEALDEKLLRRRSRR